MKKQIRIKGWTLGDDAPPFVIAEMSGNHDGSLDRALQIVDAAAAAGVAALKIQTYTAETMTLDIDTGEFRISDKKSLWAGESLYKLYQRASTPWEWHKAIFDRCRQKGMLGFSTPFDFTAVDFLESLKVPLYKISSFEIIDIPLIRRVAKTGKPIIMSTGLASPKEIGEAVAAARRGGAKDIVLLKCTSAYPAPDDAANLATMADLRRRFGCLVGLSDHTLGIGASVAATALGACVIEKHFTVERASGGVDSAFSLEPHEMKLLVSESQRARKTVGKVSYALSAREKPSVLHRRSLYIARDVKAGERLSAENLRSIRPGLGLPPKHYDGLLGRVLVKDARKGTPMSWSLVKKSAK